MVAADDVRQDIFVRLLGSCERFGNQAHIRTWLYAVAQNCCHDYFRSRAYEEERLAFLLPFRSERNFLDLAEPIWDILHTEQSVLSPVTAILIKLAYVDGYSHEEIADLVGAPPRAVSKRINRGLLILK
jgi:RNA polymerase sigma-70 factor (ECF subfamily)